MSDYLGGRRASENGADFDLVCYVGDGANDFCPMLGLREGDLAFARRGKEDSGRGYSIGKVLERRAQEGLHLKAERVDWTHGGEIVDRIREKLKELEERMLKCCSTSPNN